MGISELKEVYENYNKLIVQKYSSLLRKSTGDLATKENMSILLSQYILEDCEYIIKLICKGVKKRYIYNIIRTMCESIIEYKYFIKYENLISQYFGSEISYIDESSTDESNLYIYKEYGQKRFACFNGKKNIFNMAKDIEEIENTDKELSLYYIFSMMSENIHNAYFNAVLDDMAESDGKDVKIDEEFVTTLVITLLNKFYETYNNV